MRPSTRITGGLSHPGVPAALGAAVLFGAGTPLAKLLLNALNPWLLAGLLYLGSGLGLLLCRLLGRARPVRLSRGDLPWFAGAIVAGGILAPILLMLGLANLPASGAALLLNTEGVFTALLAWFVFRENCDGRIALGMLAIVAGAVVLSWPGEARFAGTWPALAVLGACFLWGLDNNLTRRISLIDATWLAAIKGLVAGLINLLLAMMLTEAAWPALPELASGLVVGFFAYGVSLVLFIVSLRHLGTARSGAYFSVSPFIGALLAVAMGERLSPQTVWAAGLMAAGLLLHLSERHEHEHAHEALEHRHEPVCDAHHAAPDDQDPCHRHRPMIHCHPHYPDAHHHQHRH